MENLKQNWNESTIKKILLLMIRAYIDVYVLQLFANLLNCNRHQNLSTYI